MFLVNILIYHVTGLLKFVHVLTERSGHSGSDYRSLHGWGERALVVVLFNIRCLLAFVSVWRTKEDGIDL